MSDMNVPGTPSERPTGELAAGAAVSVAATEGGAAVVGTATVVGPPSEEFSDFKQLYTLLFCCTALFVATMWLPIEGRHLDLYAKDSIAGGFLAVFSAYGVLAGWMNVHRSKMIVWPAFFAAADGLYIVTMRGMELCKHVPEADKSTMNFRDWIHLFGSGYYVISLISLLVIWTLLTAVMSGAKKDAARKAEAKAARQAKK